MNYVLIDWKGIGSHSSRVPAELDMIFIPNFNNILGEDIIRINKEAFTSLMIIFGQIKLLQVISRRLNINNNELEHLQDQYFN